jgi:hypothetical protein
MRSLPVRAAPIKRAAVNVATVSPERHRALQSSTLMSERRTVIEVLFREGCPHVPLAIARVRLAAVGHETEIELRLIRVQSSEEAVTRRFLGSPSVRVDGDDVEQGVRSVMYGLFGRGYWVADDVDYAPPARWVRCAIEGAINGRRHVATARLQRGARTRAASSTPGRSRSSPTRS